MSASEFLLWTEVLAAWSAASYLLPDPSRGGVGLTRRQKWKWCLLLSGRVVAAFVSLAWAVDSPTLGAAIALAILVQALLRYRQFRAVLLTEFMCLTSVPLLALLMVMRGYGSSLAISLTEAHLSALCLIAAILPIVIRGGAYIVTGVLEFAKVEAVPAQGLRRGYLIGFIERLILSIIVTFGSFAALGFLVAAKGLIRSPRFIGEDSRDFTEYFLIGTLTSTLIAMLGGLLLRYSLTQLWPELLLKMG